MTMFHITGTTLFGENGEIIEVSSTEDLNGLFRKDYGPLVMSPRFGLSVGDYLGGYFMTQPDTTPLPF